MKHSTIEKIWNWIIGLVLFSGVVWQTVRSFTEDSFTETMLAIAFYWIASLYLTSNSDRKHQKIVNDLTVETDITITKILAEMQKRLDRLEEKD